MNDKLDASNFARNDPRDQMTFDVSIIVPVHNAEPHLPQTFELLLRQSGPSVEIIVVDDHSSDKTFQVVNGWSGVLPNLTVISAIGRGVASARNQAVSSARGEYVWFTDCDDTWESSIVTDMLIRARTTGADITICNAVKILPDGPGSSITDASSSEILTGELALRRLFRGEVQGHLWNKLFKRSLFDGNPFPPTRAHSDLGAMFGLLAASSTVAFLPKQLYNYFIHAGSILNGREYRWDDLQDCLVLANRAADTISSSEGTRADLAIFKYQNVVIPLVNETVRREEWTDKPDIAALRAKLRNSTRFPDLLLIIKAGKPKLAARVLVLKITPRLYFALYRTHRNRVWSTLDKEGPKASTRRP